MSQSNGFVKIGYHDHVLDHALEDWCWEAEDVHDDAVSVGCRMQRKERIRCVRRIRLT